MNLSSILVVDADNASRIQVVHELRELGHDVAESCNAVDALQTTKRLMVAARLEAVRAARSREDAEFVRMVGSEANQAALTKFFA